jgi:hypothetical protein
VCINVIEKIRIYLPRDGLSLIMKAVEEKGIVGNHCYFQNNSTVGDSLLIAVSLVLWVPIEIQFILHACAAFPSQSLYSAVSSTDIVYFNDWVTMRMDTGRTVNREANSVGGNAHSRLDMLLEKKATTSGWHLSQKSRKSRLHQSLQPRWCVGTQSAWLVVGVFDLAFGNHLIRSGHYTTYQSWPIHYIDALWPRGGGKVSSRTWTT